MTIANINAAGQPSAPHGSDDATVRPGPRLLLRKRPPRRTGPRPLPSPQRAQQELDACNGDVTRTAAQLGISRDQLNRMIRREGLRVVRVRSGSGLQPHGPRRSDTEAREESDEASDEASERPQRSAERRAQCRWLNPQAMLPGNRCRSVATSLAIASMSGSNELSQYAMRGGT